MTETLVERALGSARDGGGPLALLLVDARDVERLDRAHGHAAGARALAQLEARVRAAAPPPAEIVRVARERIAVVPAAPCEAPEALAQALAAAARAPLDGDLAVRLDATVGVALAHGEGTTAADLLRDADGAAQRARAGARPWRLADAGARERELRRLRLEADLTGAPARGELALYVQPIVSLRRGALLGVEALVRWRHPERGLLGPAQFLPLAEESGLIVEIGDWMLDAVCGEVDRWRAGDPARPLPFVALNVSGRELRDGRLLARFTAALDEGRLPAGAVTLEIAEPEALLARGDADELLADLRRLGIRVVLDQFGSSRSSLMHLAELPFDGLKLDRALLQPAAERSIAEAVVELARALGMSITIPGIETEQQLAVARSLQVDAAQGHLIGRPAPAGAATDLGELEREAQASARTAGGAGAGESGDEWVSLSAAASALGVSPSTVRRLADQGALPGVRTEGGHRRFRRGDVQRLARERRREPCLRPWELPVQPLPATAALLDHDGQTLAERAARALYEPQRPGWFAAPPGLARTRSWLAALVAATAEGAPEEAVAATAAFADAAVLGGASASEVARYLGQFSAVASHELRRGGGADEARAVQRIVSAGTEAFLERLAP